MIRWWSKIYPWICIYLAHRVLWPFPRQCLSVSFSATVASVDPCRSNNGNDWGALKPASRRCLLRASLQWRSCVPKSPRRQQSLGHRFWTFKNNIIYRYAVQFMHDASLNMYNYVCILHIWFFFGGISLGIPKFPYGQKQVERCQAVAGLSLGEYTALAVAGVFDFETGLKVVKLRGEAMQARNGSRDATTGASLPCFTNLMIFHAAVRPLFGTAAALGWKAPTLCYSAIILNLAILNPARLRGLVPLNCVKLL